MIDLLIGQAYYQHFDPKLRAARQPYPPLGALYAAAILRQRGVEVALFESMLAESEALWEESLDRWQPRLAALVEDNFNYLSKMCLERMRRAAFTMVDMARARGIEVIVAGSDASDEPEAYLGAGAGYVVRGEGEETLAELVPMLLGSEPRDLAAVLGLSYREHDQPVHNPQRPPIRDLDALPHPAWDLVDMKAYRRIWKAHHGRFSLNMVTSRGCPYHCNWCAKPIWGQTYHVRSPEDVVAELVELVERHSPDHIWFMDDIMGLKPGWFEHFADLVEAESLQVPFKCLSRPDLVLRRGQAGAMKRAGCETVWIGAESGSQRVLDAMEKGTCVEQIHEATHRLRAAGVGVAFFVQFGYPGETRQDIEATLRLLRELRPDDLGISVSYPLPGTPFHERVKAELGTKRHWDHSDDLAMMYRGPFSTSFYRRLHRLAHKELRARRAWHELRPLLRRPGTLRPAHLARAGGALLRAATLPADRLLLEGLAWLPHRGTAPLQPALSAEEAATPSPQQD